MGPNENIEILPASKRLFRSTHGSPVPGKGMLSASAFLVLEEDQVRAYFSL
jgi:hypothetical protein